MSRAKILFAAWLLAVAGVIFAFAQAPQLSQNRMGNMPMGNGMPGMGNSIRREVMAAFLLPQLESELGLSAQQVGKLAQMKQEMVAKGKGTADQIAAKEKELDSLLGQGTSKGMEVKRLLEQIATIRAQKQYAAYEASSRMKAELSDSQRAKLAELKPMELRQAMMSHMKMGDMMEMMQFMGEGGMMMGSGMMGMMGMMTGMGQGMPMQGPGMQNHDMQNMPGMMGKPK